MRDRIRYAMAKHAIWSVSPCSRTMPFLLLVSAHSHQSALGTRLHGVQLVAL
jgi:hypothetical protein